MLPPAAMEKHCLVLLFASFIIAAPARGEESFQLAIGEQKGVPIARGARFSVGNPEVIHAKATQLSDGGSLLLVKGKGQGYSDIVVLSNDAPPKSLSFRVVTKLQRAVSQAGESALQGSGVKLEAQAGGWLLRGQAKNAEDWNASKAFEEQGKGKVQSLLKLHPLARLRAEQEIRRRMTQAGLGGVSVIGVGSTILLQGDVADTQEKELAEALAREVFRGARSHLRVPFESAQGLRFHAKILELLNSDVKALGLDWSGSTPGVLQIGKTFSKFGFQFDAVLKALERRGKARVLSQPQIYLNERGVAELRVGGEIPVPVKTRTYSNVQWKPYGLSLKLEVPGASRDRARAKISVEISGLDPNTGLDGVPGIRVSRMDTVVDLEKGKPVLLSGLMESRRSEQMAGLPLLADIPVLGELFRSKDFQQNRSELVIWLEARDN